MKREPWFPVDANFQDDSQILGVSGPSELVYFRSVALAKRLKRPRIEDVHLRRLCDKFEDLGKTNDIEAETARELCDAGLWQLDDVGYVIVAYDGWNGAADRAQEASIEHGRYGAHVKNHAKRGIKEEGCGYCEGTLKPPTKGVSKPPSSPPSSPPPGPLQADKTRQDETRRDENYPSSPPISQRETYPQGDDDGLVQERTTSHPADQILAPLGIVAATATAGERATVERAIEQGWTTDALIDLAHVAASKEEPRSYLAGMLTKRANTTPTAPPASNGTTALAPGADWLAKWTQGRHMVGTATAKLATMIDELGDPAGRALFNIRTIARNDTEITAKQAFRASYLANLEQDNN
jgi:hypothetical protein